MMKNLFKLCFLVLSLQLVFTGLANAQLTTLPRGGNKKASVSEQIGIGRTRFGEDVTLLDAMDVLARKAGRALAATGVRHDHDAVSDLEPF